MHIHTSTMNQPLAIQKSAINQPLANQTSTLGQPLAIQISRINKSLSYHFLTANRLSFFPVICRQWTTGKNPTHEIKISPMN